MCYSVHVVQVIFSHCNLRSHIEWIIHKIGAKISLEATQAWKSFGLIKFNKKWNWKWYFNVDVFHNRISWCIFQSHASLVRDLGANSVTSSAGYRKERHGSTGSNSGSITSTVSSTRTITKCKVEAETHACQVHPLLTTGHSQYTSYELGFS